MEQHRWAAVLAAGDGAVLAGLAAARADGLRRVWSRRGDAIDVIVPGQRRPGPLLHRLPAEWPAVFVHRVADLPDQDRQRGLPDRTSTARSLVDAARWAIADEEAQTIIAAASRSSCFHRSSWKWSTGCRSCGDAG